MDVNSREAALWSETMSLKSRNEWLEAEIERLRSDLAEAEKYNGYHQQACLENARLQAVVDWVDSWVSNPVGSYSVSALDGLFARTRDRIAALKDTTP